MPKKRTPRPPKPKTQWSWSYIRGFFKRPMGGDDKAAVADAVAFLKRNKRTDLIPGHLK